MSIESSDAADVGRPLKELSDSGLLWLINRVVFHPQGFSLALHYDEETKTITGWSLMGDGTEPWSFTRVDDGMFFERASETLRVAMDENDKESS